MANLKSLETVIAESDARMLALQEAYDRVKAMSDGGCELSACLEALLRLYEKEKAFGEKLVFRAMQEN